MKPFAQWTKEDVEEEFAIQADSNLPALHAWIGVIPNLSETDTNLLDALAQKLLRYVHDWNEEELKIYFLAAILNMVDFYQPLYRPFLERELSVTYGAGKRLWGIVDFVVASGKQTPRKPFFFLHEYKKQLYKSNDPLGQLLAAMVAAQIVNSNQHPIYGAYIIDRHWYFVLLEGSIYAESLAYDATKNDIFNIVAILRDTKNKIDQLI